MNQEREEVQQQIHQRREEIGDTVAALAAKADVKSNATRKAEELRTQAKTGGERAARQVAAAPRDRRVQLAIMVVVVAAAAGTAWQLIRRYRG